MLSKGMMSKLRQFDAYPKTMEDFRIKTYSGAIVTIVSGIIILLLFASELKYYLTTEVTPELLVDYTRDEKLRINVNITFPKLPCPYLSVDVMDISGDQQLDVFHTLTKTRLTEDGKPIATTESKQNTELQPLPANYCGDCYGAQIAELQCCNTCEEVREAYRRQGWAFTNADKVEQCIREGWDDMMKAAADEGCSIYGYMSVNKVAGNFHFAPGKSFQHSFSHVHDVQSLKIANFNLTHYIHRLSFGIEYPGQVNPLDNWDILQTNEKAGSGFYQYFIKIVPTQYLPLDAQAYMTNQYSATSHTKIINHAAGEQGLPGVFFYYDLAPMLVRITESRRSFAQFLTSVCAIVGGVFTVAGLIDSIMYHSYRKLKIQMGKQT